MHERRGISAISESIYKYLVSKIESFVKCICDSTVKIFVTRRPDRKPFYPVRIFYFSCIQVQQVHIRRIFKLDSKSTKRYQSRAIYFKKQAKVENILGVLLFFLSRRSIKPNPRYYSVLSGGKRNLSSDSMECQRLSTWCK